MAKRDTEKFLRLMNEQNAKIAARKAIEEAEQKALRGDPMRIQHDKERREKWGQLRARPRMRRRPIKARTAFGRVDMTPDK